MVHNNVGVSIIRLSFSKNTKIIFISKNNNNKRTVYHKEAGKIRYGIFIVLVIAIASRYIFLIV